MSSEKLSVLRRKLPINKVEQNTGQIDGLPANPRTISTERLELLKQSILNFPQMMELREVVVFPVGDKFVAIGGNMRLLACRDLEIKSIEAKILPPDFPVEKLKEFIIKDNVEFGETDINAIKDDWDDLPLNDWGMSISAVGDTFEPNMSPETSYQKVTAADIVKTQDQLENQFKDKADEFVEVSCPHCAETFYIRGE